MKENNLIYDQYTFSDIIDIKELTTIFEKFSKATNYALGIVDNNTLKILVKAGWQDICVNFHRADKKACKLCEKSNKNIFENLDNKNTVKIIECEHGLYYCATPIIIEGKYVANILTGQLFTQKPDRKRFEKQAEIYGFDKIKYLEAFDKISIVDEKKLLEIADYLSEMAVFIAKTGLNKINANKLNAELKEKNQELQNSSEEIRAADEELTATFDAVKELNEELTKSNNQLKESQIKLKSNEHLLKEAQKIANLGHWKFDLIKNELIWSDQVYRIFELEPQEFEATYESFIENIHPEDREMVDFAYINSLKTKQSYEIEHRLKLKSGEIKYVLEKCNTDFDKKGNPIHSIGTVLDITESKKTEQKLKNQNDDYLALNEEYAITNENLLIEKEKTEIAKEQYKNITRSTLDIIFIIDKSGKILFINDRVEDILGYNVNNLIGKPFLNFVPKQEIPHYLLKLKDVFIKKEIKNFITYGLHKSGRLIDVEINEKLIRYKGRLAVQGTMRDVSERKITEQKLKRQNDEYAKLNKELIKSKERVEESNQRFKVLSSATNEAIFILEKGICIETNEAACKMFGYSYDELIGIFGTDVIANESKELVRQNLSLSESSPYDAIGLRKDGTKFYAEFQGKMFQNKGKELRITAVRDITIRKKSEIALKESENKFKNIFEHSPVGIIIFDVKGNPININKQILKILGSKSAEETKKINILNFQNLKKIGFSESFNKCIEKKEIIEKETFYESKWGTYKNVRYILTPILDNQNNVTGVLSIYEDFTERKKAEQDLIIAKEKAEESDRLKTEFINNMSHEIRTPMNGILGFADLLKKPNITPEKRKQFINIIQNSGNQLLRIIDDILEISRLGTKQVHSHNKEICLNDILLDLFSVFGIKAKEQQIPLYLKKGLSDRQSTIYTDETKLRKILSNLLENALKFTNSGFVELGYELKNNYLQIYVKDTGIGIDKSKHNAIFNRFSQADKGLSRKFGGLGLGLSIAKENTELLGGEIIIESEEGKGSTFIVKIPYKAVNTEILNTKKQYTILITEDEEINTLYLETALNELDFNIKTIHAKNGKEAIEICEQNKDIDLVFMDLKMPILNGYDATTKIKQKNTNLPIIAQTAYTTEEDKQKAIKAGCSDFISKPINEETLNDIIKKYLIEN